MIFTVADNKRPICGDLIKSAVLRSDTLRGAAAVGLLLAQPPQFLQQRIDLQLLTVYRHVQLFQQVFAVAGLDFQLSEPLVGVRSGVHSAIGQDFLLLRALFVH